MRKKRLLIFLLTLIIFIAYTVCISHIDVQPIGPNGSTVGFASINNAFKNLISFNLYLYILTNIFDYLSLLIVVAYFIYELVNLIKTKDFNKLHFNIVALGILYVVTFIVYISFELVVVNYRPILINGVLEASYPSSTCVVALVIYIANIKEMKTIFKSKKLYLALTIISLFIIAFLMGGRILSGVHWLTDVIGSILLSGTLLHFYYLIRSLIYHEDKS